METTQSLHDKNQALQECQARVNSLKEFHRKRNFLRQERERELSHIQSGIDDLRRELKYYFRKKAEIVSNTRDTQKRGNRTVNEIISNGISGVTKQHMKYLLGIQSSSDLDARLHG